MDYYWNIFGNGGVVFLYLFLEGVGVVFFDQYKGGFGRKCCYCCSILVIDMKCSYYCQVDVIVMQCILSGGVIFSEVQVVMGNYYIFWLGGGVGGEENFCCIVS